MRNIDDILLLRGDISPFLVHLTRDLDGVVAETRLVSILDSHELRPGDGPVSDARYGGTLRGVSLVRRRQLFNAVCFTETPLAEAHCLLEIDARRVNLEPFGLVFMKDRLKARGVCPVIYINNEQGDMDVVARALFSLKDAAPDAAELLLPLLAIFGQKLQPTEANQRQGGTKDFAWEREWRYPHARGPFQFELNDVYCALCPDERIVHFEERYPGLRFVDPRRNLKWYAASLIEASNRQGISYSVA